MIRTENLTFHVGAFALRQVGLDVASGQYFVLLGPPGSGKTVLLECLCGLRRIDSGRVVIAGRDVTGLEPRARDIGYVPQDYALFPHLSVEGNIAFSLRIGRRQRRRTSERVEQVAQMLGIEHLLERRIAGLSGGEKQRTALARALAPQPKVLLLDEPVCALDEVTRQSVCAQLRHLQRRLGLTVLHVSHDLEEAFSVADRAAILHEGDIQQAGTPQELLRAPESEFVARFMRCENIFRAEAQEASPDRSRTAAKVAGVTLEIAGAHEGTVKLAIRPEDIRIFPANQRPDDTDNHVPVRLTQQRDYGSYVRLDLEGEIQLVAHLAHAEAVRLPSGDRAALVAVLPIRAIHVLPE